MSFNPDPAGAPPPARRTALIVGGSVVACVLIVVGISALFGERGAPAIEDNPQRTAFEDASKRLEYIVKQMEASKRREAAPEVDVPANAEDDEAADPNLKPIPAEALKNLLPADLPGFTREDASTTSAGVAGFSFAVATARYAEDDAGITVTLTDLGAAGAIAALGAAFGASSTEESAKSYSKMGVVDGRMVTEQFNAETKSGSLGVVVGNRIMVMVEGHNVAITDLKRAADTIDMPQVERLAAEGGSAP